MNQTLYTYNILCRNQYFTDRKFSILEGHSNKHITGTFISIIHSFAGWKGGSRNNLQRSNNMLNAKQCDRAPVRFPDIILAGATVQM